MQKMAKPKKLPQFRLAPGEELLICPYDMSHHVTNLRMTIHILKCRRNYEKACQEDGELVQMISCRYNWGHQVPHPELLHHEKTCEDRYSVITHIMEFTNLGDIPYPSSVKKYSREVYRTLGVPSIEESTLPASTRHNSEAGSISGRDSFDDSSRTGSSFKSALTSFTERSNKKKEVFEIPKLFLKSYPKGTSITVKATCLSRRGTSTVKSEEILISSTNNSVANLPVNQQPKKKNSIMERSAKPISELCYQSTTSQAGSTATSAPSKPSSLDKSLYEWEFDPAVKSYDPMLKFETEVSIRFPAGLSKAQRRAWKDENVAKVQNLHGGSFGYFTPAAFPGSPLPRRTANDADTSTTSAGSSIPANSVTSEEPYSRDTDDAHTDFEQDTEPDQGEGEEEESDDDFDERLY